MDLDISGVSDDDEEDPGGYVRLNDDDDNMNGTPDKDEMGPVNMENDLVQIDLSYEPPSLTGYAKLESPSGGQYHLRVWTSPTKGIGNMIIGDSDEKEVWPIGQMPSTLWVEGYSTGPAELWLLFTPDQQVYPGGGYNHDPVKFTVVEVDLDMEGVPDAEETKIGGFIGLNDDDDNHNETPDKDETGPITGEDDLVKITLKDVLPTDLPIDDLHPVVLNAIAGGSKIKVWDNAQKEGIPIFLPKYYVNRSQLPDELWVEAINVSSYPRDITLAMEYTIAGHTFDDRINITVVGLDLEWETYQDNTPIDPHPEVPPNGGKRIFPGKKNYNDTNPGDRKKVRVKGILTPAVDNRHVYFSVWDVDDPCSSPIIDTYDKPAGPSGPDNYGKRGDENAYLSSTNAVTDGSGIARTMFIVSMNPGDNFKIAGSVKQTKLSQMTQEKADGLEPLPDSVVLSEMLTVWRKLWIEQDSMGAVASSGPEKNYVSGTASSYQDGRVYLGQNLPDELDDEDQFDFGGYRPTNKPPYLVWYNSSHLIAEDYADVRGDPNADGAAMTYDLFDDDYYPGTSQPRVTLPSYPGLDSYAVEFARAYIETIYLTDQQDIVSFNRNLSYLEIEWGQGDWNDHFGCPPSADFWSVLSVTCFQPRSSKDGDPETQVWPGEAHPSRNDLALYLEVIENEAGEDVSRIMAHEIGHTGGLEECDTTGCIMEHGDHFCDHCLSDMRANGSGW